MQRVQDSPTAPVARIAPLARLAPFALVTLLILCGAGVAYAQFGRGFGGFFRVRPHYADANTFGHGFNYCRVMYTSNRNAYVPPRGYPQPAARGGPPITRTPSATSPSASPS